MKFGLQQPKLLLGLAPLAVSFPTPGQAFGPLARMHLLQCGGAGTTMSKLRHAPNRKQVIGNDVAQKPRIEHYRQTRPLLGNSVALLHQRFAVGVFCTDATLFVGEAQIRRHCCEIRLALLLGHV